MQNLLHKFWKWKTQFTPLEQKRIIREIASQISVMKLVLSWSKFCSILPWNMLRMIRWSPVLEYSPPHRTYFTVYLCTTNKLSTCHSTAVCLMEDLKQSKKSTEWDGLPQALKNKCLIPVMNVCEVSTTWAVLEIVFYL